MNHHHHFRMTYLNTSRKTAVFASLGFLLLAAMPVTAAVLYAEGADLTSNLARPAYLGNLVEGTNTISGSVSGSCGSFTITGTRTKCEGTGDEADAFSFLIGDDFNLVSATATISNYSSSGDARADARSFSSLLAFRFTGNLTDVNLLPAFEVLGIQDYQFLSIYSSENASSQFNWRVTLITERRPAVVPLPGTLPLVFAALGALAWASARRKSS